MYISPPIAVLAILAVGVTATAWFASPRPREVTETVMVPTATYLKLAQWANNRVGADGRPLTIGQAIEELAHKSVKNSEAPDQAGTRVR